MKAILPAVAVSLLLGGTVGYLVGNGSDSTATEEEKVVSIPEQTRKSEGGAQSGAGRKKEGMTYAEITSAPGQTARVQALIEHYSDLSTEEFANEADQIQDLPFNERILAAFLLFSAWAEVSPYDALDHARGKMGRTGMFVMPTILQSWAATDPQSAAGYFETNKSQFAMMSMFGGRRGGSSGAATIAGEWAKQDPEGALKWAETLEGREKNQATVKALSQLAVSDPSRAAGLTDGLDGRELESAQASVAREWAKKDWAATEAWLNGLPADQKAAATSSAIRSLALEDPNLAANKALAIQEGDARNEAVESVAEAMGRENPSEAISWVMKNGNEESQRESVGDVVGSWVAQDRNAAFSWVNEQPEGRVRDAAVSSFVMNDHNASGADGVALAETIGDDRTRAWSMSVATMRWASEDSGAAKAYIESSDAVDDNAKERILRRVNGGGGRRDR